MADLQGAIQTALDADDDFETGDTIVQYVVVAVVQNFESGDEGIYIVDSAPGERTLPRWRARGMLGEALAIFDEPPDDD